MADEKEFDVRVAMSRQQDLITQARRIRDGINADVIDYYKDRAPKDDDQMREYRDGIRRYLLTARDRINDLVGQMR